MRLGEVITKNESEVLGVSLGMRMFMLQELWLVHPDGEMCAAFHRRFADLPNVRVVEAKFEELEPHDCFVTAGNAFGIMTAGIDAAVVRFFGEDLMRRIQHRIMDEYLGEQPVGTAFLEATGHSRYPFVAHSPTMRVPGSIRGTDKVYVATWAALLAVFQHNLREEQKIEVVAFPAMGTGFGGWTGTSSSNAKSPFATTTARS
jgi:O-acetyl-ADP-ribose deacetylase (regulator of RNase III)